jgi:hypothetical protein
MALVGLAALAGAQGAATTTPAAQQPAAQQPAASYRRHSNRRPSNPVAPASPTPGPPLPPPPPPDPGPGRPRTLPGHGPRRGRARRCGSRRPPRTGRSRYSSHWERTWDDAVGRVSKETKKPILVCINMDGEIASEHYAGVRYRQPEVAALFEPYVCVIASVYRHNPRDYDAEGRRIECPRFHGVTCGEHIAMEPRCTTSSSTSAASRRATSWSSSTAARCTTSSTPSTRSRCSARSGPGHRRAQDPAEPRRPRGPAAASKRVASARARDKSGRRTAYVTRGPDPAARAAGAGARDGRRCARRPAAPGDLRARRGARAPGARGAREVRARTGRGRPDRRGAAGAAGARGARGA